MVQWIDRAVTLQVDRLRHLGRDRRRAQKRRAHEALGRGHAFAVRVDELRLDERAFALLKDDRAIDA